MLASLLPFGGRGSLQGRLHELVDVLLERPGEVPVGLVDRRVHDREDLHGLLAIRDTGLTKRAVDTLRENRLELLGYLEEGLFDRVTLLLHRDDSKRQEAVVTPVSRLKDRTLKNVYERRAMREGAPQLLEAVDQQKLQQITQTLTKLEGLVPDGAAIFNQAIEAAKADLGAYLQGGVKQFFKNMAGDPVLKATSFANAIRAGLSNLPTIARLYLPRGAEKEAQRSIYELTPVEKQPQLVQQMVKAFEPESKVDLAALFKGNAMPYVQNLQAAVQELLQNVAPNGGFKLAQQVAATPAPEVEQAPQPQQAGQAPTAQGQAEPTPKPAAQSATATTPTQPAAQTQAAANTAPTTQTQAAQPAQTSSTGKRMSVNDKPAIDDLAAYLTKKVGVDAATLTKVLTQLAKEQKLLA